MVYQYIDVVESDDETPGPTGPIGNARLPSSNEEDDISFDAAMSKALEEHASDDISGRQPLDNIPNEEKEQLVEESERELPEDVAAGRHHQVEVRASDSFDPYETDSSDLHMDTDFDPDSILPVDMGNPEVR